MGGLFARVRRMGFMLVVGVCLVSYAALGIFYWQQGAKQADLEEQIRKTTIIATKPLPNAEKLQAEYEAINRALAPITVPAALETIVGIARQSGIDITPGAGKFNISPPGAPVGKKIGENQYQVLPIQNINVRGDPDAVTAFISDLDSGNTLRTMVLKKLHIRQAPLEIKTEEKVRREEFRDVQFAVLAMMRDNGLSEIPVPLDYAGGVATNDMGSAPTKGFPDVATSAADKGYTSSNSTGDTPRNGYVLYNHDKIFSDNTSQFETVSYFALPTTEYYYTVEADGTVRQFDGPNTAMATEYPDNEREARRTEKFLVQFAVLAMMGDNGLSEIPAPLDYAGGVATNDMGSAPTKGFPDAVTSAADKGYTGSESPRGGYVLYSHDRIFADNATQFETVSYFALPTTEYYYTVEADGTVRQFDGPDIATATEYLDVETVATLDIEIYTKPAKDDKN